MNPAFELACLEGQRDALVAAFRTMVAADPTLSKAEKNRLVECVEDNVADAFFPHIDPLEAELNAAALAKRVRDERDLRPLV